MENFADITETHSAFVSTSSTTFVSTSSTTFVSTSSTTFVSTGSTTLVSTGSTTLDVSGLSGKRRQKPRRWRLWVWGMFLLLALGAGVWNEMNTSFWQSYYLSQYAEKLSYTVEPGPSREIVFPKYGPFNTQRGYDRIPDFQRRLEAAHFTVKEQARFSPELLKIAEKGITPPYSEEPSAGLLIRDVSGTVVYDAAAGSQVYKTFEDIPPLIVKSLLFIEDRELGNKDLPFRNPVINWERFSLASLLYAANKAGIPVKVEGGSTLATQLEKYRYSPDGNTGSGFEKLRQMASAMLRVYKDGPETLGAREKIILDYINTAPLAAVPGRGEIYGIGEGFLSWFGLNLYDVSIALFSPDTYPEKAKVFKQALTLLCAVRAPTYYMVQDYPALENRVSGYISLMEKEGLISPDFAARARDARFVFNPGKYVPPPLSFAMRKALGAVRTKLMQTLGIPGYYDLDRMDMEVETTVNASLQRDIAGLFGKLREPEFLKENGLRGDRLLSTGNADEVIYSFMLFESTPYGNLLRIHADNFEQPFDINEGMKLILGSTAKLRTLAHYLEIVALLYHEITGMDKNALFRLRSTTFKAYRTDAKDPVTRWVLARLRQNPALTEDELLAEALERSYSANPDEEFFTGGGIHTFENFRDDHNDKILSVREATVHSINLVYIRLMRDLSEFHKARLPYNEKSVLRNTDDPERQRLLYALADDEAKYYLHQFYKSYKNLPREKILETLLGNRAASARHLSIAFLAWHPGAGEADLAGWLKEQNIMLSPEQVSRLFSTYSKPNLTLSDYGFLLRKHPLELWAAGYMLQHSGVKWKTLVEESPRARRDAYQWLFQPKMRKAQDIRLRIRIEREAFARMTPFWQKLGFPFKKLVSSYSTAIGSSCDQPAALAQLIGIIINDGIRRPAVSVKQIRIGEATPYHTVFDFSPRPGEQVMEPAVARTLRSVLEAVVEEGTARRAKGVFMKPDGTPVPVGGKTGTGDNRFKEFNAKGEIVTSRALNRTATFAFYIADRYFGVITAFVNGSDAQEYSFTSALPVNILKLLAPAINAHIAVRSELETLSKGETKDAASSVSENNPDTKIRVSNMSNVK